METTLITGGAGFIGSALTNALLAEGRREVVVDNLFTGKREYLDDSPQLVFEEVDIRDSAALSRVFETHKPRDVFHLAAIHYIPYCDQHPHETYEVNVWGTKVLIETMKQCPPDRFFFMSTAAVYDPSSTSQHEKLPSRPSDVYGQSKAIGEDLTRAYAGESGVPSVIGRLFNVYGHNETNPHLIPVILEQLSSGARAIQLGNIHTKRDYIFVSDVVAALRALMKSPKEKLVVANIGTGKSYSAEDVVNACASIIGEPVRIEIDEARKRASDRPILEADVHYIASLTSWQPTVSLAEGLAALLEGARTNPSPAKPTP